ncbi:MAG: sugar phosphate isomerase/epimerase [Pseudomonadales bacterium]|nr:sugar phosphate isomerase/epimerase [Pseudomonadales bacterium]
MKRRNFIATAAVGSAGLASGSAMTSDQVLPQTFKLKHNINHSVCEWCFSDIPFEDFLKTLKELGVNAIDLIGPDRWPILKKYDIHCSMCNGAEISLTEGWNNPKYHEQLIKNYTEMIPKVAEAGYTNLICFSGNRNGINDYVGLQNCVDGLSQIIPLAEKHGVIIQMELFNQVNHPDYMCDSSLWGVELCKHLGSDNFKLLYDIYHMQIQEGDIIRSIQESEGFVKPDILPSLFGEVFLPKTRCRRTQFGCGDLDQGAVTFTPLFGFCRHSKVNKGYRMGVLFGVVFPPPFEHPFMGFIAPS